MGVGLEGDVIERRIDRRRQAFDRLAIRLAILIDRLRLNVNRIAEIHQHRAAKCLLRRVVQTGGHDAERHRRA